MRANAKYNTDRISNANCKQKVMWKVVNENCNFSKKSYSDLPDIYINETKDTKTSDPLKKVNCLNEYFVKIPQIIHTNLTF